MELQNKKVSVFGMGKSGVSALKLLVKKGSSVTAVNSGTPNSWNNYDEVSSIVGHDNCISEDDASEKFSNSDLIILSPGISREHHALKKALESGIEVWSEIELGYRFVNSPIIALTGTNGKTTTVSMIGDMISACGKSVFVGGNIGVPLCDYILDEKECDYIILELSSFQLESMVDFRPNIAVILNVFPNHGERYDSVQDYAEAKFNITNNMTEDDFLIYPSDMKIISEWADKQVCKRYGIESTNYDEIKAKIKKEFSIDKFKLQGMHNLSNLFFGIKVLKLLGINLSNGIQKSINRFGGVEFRLQYIECDKSYTVFNDAKSTNWDATLTAIKSIDKGSKKLTFIIGGKKRGRGDSIRPHLEVLKDKIDKVLLIGETSDDFASEIGPELSFEKCKTIDNAIDLMDKEEYDGILVLSPAFPSFDQFKNYIERGNYFTKIVTKK